MGNYFKTFDMGILCYGKQYINMMSEACSVTSFDCKVQTSSPQKIYPFSEAFYSNSEKLVEIMDFQRIFDVLNDLNWLFVIAFSLSRVC